MATEISLEDLRARVFSVRTFIEPILLFLAIALDLRPVARIWFNIISMVCSTSETKTHSRT